MELRHILLKLWLPARLDKEASEYLRPRALSRLSGGADAYLKLRQSVRATQKDAAEYAPKVADLARVKQTITTQTQLLAQLTTRQTNLEHLQHLWPQWVARLDAESRLNELDDAPANIEIVQEEIRTLVQDVRELDGQLAVLEGELAALPEAKLKLVAAGPELEILGGELAAHRERERQAEALEEVHRKTASALAKHRAQLLEEVGQATLSAADLDQMLPLVEEHDRVIAAAMDHWETLLREVEAATRDVALSQTEWEAQPAPGLLSAAPVTASEHVEREEVRGAQDRFEEAQREHQSHAPDQHLLLYLPTLQQAVDQAPITS